MNVAEFCLIIVRAEFFFLGSINVKGGFMLHWTPPSGHTYRTPYLPHLKSGTLRVLLVRLLAPLTSMADISSSLSVSAHLKCKLKKWCHSFKPTNSLYTPSAQRSPRSSLVRILCMSDHPFLYLSILLVSLQSLASPLLLLFYLRWLLKSARSMFQTFFSQWWHETRFSVHEIWRIPRPFVFFLFFLRYSKRSRLSKRAKDPVRYTLQGVVATIQHPLPSHRRIHRI